MKYHFDQIQDAKETLAEIQDMAGAGLETINKNPNITTAEMMGYFTLIQLTSYRESQNLIRHAGDRAVNNVDSLSPVS